jgi:hypothetical protein
MHVCLYICLHVRMYVCTYVCENVYARTPASSEHGLILEPLALWSRCLCTHHLPYSCVCMYCLPACMHVHVHMSVRTLVCMLYLCLRCDALCCAVPCYAVMRCAALCCAVPCCAVLCCAVPCCAILCCTVLYCTQGHRLVASMD